MIESRNYLPATEISMSFVDLPARRTSPRLPFIVYRNLSLNSGAASSSRSTFLSQATERCCSPYPPAPLQQYNGFRKCVFCRDLTRLLLFCNSAIYAALQVTASKPRHRRAAGGLLVICREYTLYGVRHKLGDTCASFIPHSSLHSASSIIVTR